MRGFALVAASGLSVLMLGLSALGGHLLPGEIDGGVHRRGRRCAARLCVARAARVAHPVDRPAAASGCPRSLDGVVVGSLFRIGLGATPFLLPLLLQLGFGLDPLQSGLLTCATAVGAMFMKTLTVTILRRWGFRSVLVVNGADRAAVIVAMYALLHRATPHVVIALVLLVSGCLRSLQFTALQAITFADIDARGHEPGDQHLEHGAAARAEHGHRRGALTCCRLSSAAQGHDTIVAADFPAHVRRHRALVAGCAPVASAARVGRGRRRVRTWREMNAQSRGCERKLAGRAWESGPGDPVRRSLDLDARLLHHLAPSGDFARNQCL